jgi:hypothetical protein
MTLHRIKHAAFAAFAAFALLASAQSQTVSSTSDLNYWGSGSNHAALVISWNDGKSGSTLVWGYSWNGTATAWDMLVALAQSDPRLFIRIDSATSFGGALYGIGYDANDNNTFSVTGAEDSSGNATTPIFTSGISDMNVSSSSAEAPASSASAAPSEVADHYAEGWMDNGFWEFFTGDTGTSYPSTWTSSMSGAGSTTLVNNGWYAFSITSANYTSHTPGSAIAAAMSPTPTPTPTPTATPTPAATPETTASATPIPAPSLSTSGKSILKTSSPTLMVKGFASGGVTNLTYRVGNQKWVTARASNRWSFLVRLQPGKNVITVIARGPGGKSKPLKIVIIRR